MYDDDDGFDDVNDMVDFDQEPDDAISPKSGAGQVLSTHQKYVDDNTVKTEKTPVNSSPGCVRGIVITFLILVLIGAIGSGNWAAFLFWFVVLIWYANRQVDRSVHYKIIRTVRYEKFPCSRCANEVVTVYDTGYFTCGFCGARGTYPFLTAADRKRRLGYRNLYFYKKETETI